MISLTTFPEKSLEGMIVREFVQMICVDCADDHQIELTPISELISKTRAMMRDAGWNEIYQHNFFVGLCNSLTELTNAHPVSRQFVQLLTVETEFN